MAAGEEGDDDRESRESLHILTAHSFAHTVGRPFSDHTPHLLQAPRDGNVQHFIHLSFRLCNSSTQRM